MEREGIEPKIMNTKQLREYFENEQLSEEHQNFVLDQASILDGSEKDNIVKFLLSSSFAELQVSLARTIRSKRPEKAAIDISKMIMNLSISMLSDINEDDRDQFGFQK